MHSEYTPLEKLERYGENTARSLPLTGRTSGREAAAAVRGALRILARIHTGLEQAGEEVSGAGQWLLDNWYLALREGQNAATALQRGGALRQCRDGAFLLSLACALLRSGGGAFEEERCLRFLAGVQRKTVLTRRELSLLPASLSGAAVMLLAAVYRQEAPEERAAGALFTSLRLFGTLEWSRLLEQADRTEQILREDPAGVYPLMDEDTRSDYRRQVERLAEKRGIPEHRLAARILRMSRAATEPREKHVGWWLYRRPLGEAAKIRRGGWYIAAQVLIPLFLALLGGFLTGSPWAAALLLLPLAQLCKSVTDSLLLRFCPPRRLPRMELKDGVPPEGRTICVISLLLTGEGSADEAVRHLEEYRFASRDCGEHLLFGLLIDLPESAEEETERDRALLAHTAAAVEALNERCGGGFYLLCRRRTYNRDSGLYASHERKRGALMELAKLACGRDSALEVPVGSRLGLRGVRFVLTLDADTRLTPGAARALIGAMLHPLNRAVVDARRGLVVAGHGVIQPRIGVELPAGSRSRFARIFAPQGGADPYSGCLGEVYMDAFASGGFAGKGILDVRALLACLDGRIPDGRVLSHDALEGAFLRGALMEDVQLLDSFPSTPAAYYRRQHRWVRGDWQNAPWLLAPGKELPAIERWRLFDSLRRSLTGAGELLALLAWPLHPSPAMKLVSLTALFTVFSHLLFLLLRTSLRPEEEVRVRLLSDVLHGAAGGLIETLLRLWLLPYEAWIGLSAAVTALWRMFVTKRGLLEWQTAAQSESAGRAGLRAAYASMKSAVAVGLVCLFAPTLWGKAAGAAFLLSPAAAAYLGRAKPREPSLSAADRRYLLARAGEIWSYFESFCTPEEHFLPPDNYQETPPMGVAHRTSPTNIGLAMVSALCAADLELTTRHKALGLIENQLATLERLPKWRGHLYNWYDTRSLRPLEPAYISTVDSGNLAASLITLQRGLQEYGCAALARRAEALWQGMDFTALYDSRRSLFRIGLSLEKSEEPAGSWYDLLESEERLTGYFAIATGQVPAKHWQRLSRAQVECNGYRGMASWSGTMFEYLMPELFLPLYPDSLLWESASFCLYVQKRRRFGPEKVWGKSESAFFSLDSVLSYRYKAHGCARLALCRGMDEEHVVAPYSSLLALELDMPAAMENLRRLEKLGALGPFGFWEAVDYTPDRCPRGAVVRCVMAHHLGMSMIAIANALNGGLCRRRFLAHPAMAAHACLLQEKVPLGGTLLRRREFTPPAKPAPKMDGSVTRQGRGTDGQSRVCHPLSNGLYTLLLTDSGLSLPRCGGCMPYRAPRNRWDANPGITLLLKIDGEFLSLLPRPDDRGDFSWRLTGGQAVFHGSGHGLDWYVSASVPAGEAGELRRISLRTTGGESREAALYWLFEPSLAPERDYRAHPAYSRLGLGTGKKDGMLLVRRLARGRSAPLYLACAATQEAAFSSDFHRFPGRGAPPAALEENFGWQSAPFLAAEIPLQIGGEGTSLSLALCVAGREEEALRGAARMLAEDAPAASWEKDAAALGLDSTGVAAALAMLPRLLFPQVARPGAVPERGRDGLWQLGISGDVPLIAMELEEGSLPAAAELLRRHALLRRWGVESDLVFLTHESGDYRRRFTSALEELLRRTHQEEILGRRGGIHFADAERAGAIVLAEAALHIPKNGALPPEPAASADAAALAAPFYRLPHGQQTPSFCWNEDDSFTFTTAASLPPRCWSQILTNGTLGALVSECGAGALWYRNARECPLVPWTGDVLALRGEETLEILTEGGSVSFFADAFSPCRVTYSFGAAVWEKEAAGARLRLTATVPAEGAVRLWRLESDRAVRLRWCAPLQLGPEERDAAACRVTFAAGRFRAVNPRCVYPDVVLEAVCTAPWERVCTSRSAFLAGESARPERSGEPCFAGEFILDGEAVLALGVGPLGAPGAWESVDKTKEVWRERVTRLTVQTPDPALNHLLGGWCQYQALCARILGRASLYQSGGAIGFRDQLQDHIHLLPLDSAAARRHILACCAHQYEEGDVQHWWHPGGGEIDKGVRTRCSDDLLWLVWAVCEYTEATGDIPLCREEAPYLSSAPLNSRETSRYETPRLSLRRESVLQHCRRALELVLRRGRGRHGLLLMGSGDWNDALDELGPGGESVWLTWFFALCARGFSRLLGELGEADSDWYEMAARSAAEAAEGAWDGDRYLRGYYGDGTPLGAAGERLDSVAQSFAALWPEADPARVRLALRRAVEELYDPARRLCRLCAPPYGPDERSPGYITGYGPGFRENGGQYTHASLFLVRALGRHGMVREAMNVLSAAMPEGRDGELYGAEPYVICADIYDAESCPGRAGWSWYTGAAGQFLRTVTGDLLGFHLRGGAVEWDRNAPAARLWPEYRILWRDREGREHILGPGAGEESPLPCPPDDFENSL